MTGRGRALLFLMLHASCALGALGALPQRATGQEAGPIASPTRPAYWWTGGARVGLALWRAKPAAT